MVLTEVLHHSGVGNVGDNLEIFVINDGQYAFGYIGIADDSTRRFIPIQEISYILILHPH